MTPTYEELEQEVRNLKIKLAETIVASEQTARDEFLRGQQYIKNLPSVQN